MKCFLNRKTYLWGTLFSVLDDEDDDELEDEDEDEDEHDEDEDDEEVEASLSSSPLLQMSSAMVTKSGRAVFNPFNHLAAMFGRDLCDLAHAYTSHSWLSCVNKYTTSILYISLRVL